MNCTTLNRRFRGRNSQRGQGMTEYIIIVALIAIAAIGVYSAFGHTLNHQVAAVTNGLAGKDPNAEVTAAGTEAGTATTDAGNNIGMDTYQKNVKAQ